MILLQAIIAFGMVTAFCFAFALVMIVLIINTLIITDTPKKKRKKLIVFSLILLVVVGLWVTLFVGISNAPPYED